MEQEIKDTKVLEKEIKNKNDIISEKLETLEAKLGYFLPNIKARYRFENDCFSRILEENGPLEDLEKILDNLNVLEEYIDTLSLLPVILESLEKLEESLNAEESIDKNIGNYVSVVLKCLKKFQVLESKRRYLNLDKKQPEIDKAYYKKIFSIIYKIMKYEMVYSYSNLIFEKLMEMPSFMHLINDSIMEDIKFIEDSKLVDDKVLSALKLFMSRAIIDTQGSVFSKDVIYEVTQVYSNDDIRENARVQLEKDKKSYTDNSKSEKTLESDLSYCESEKEENIALLDNFIKKINRRTAASVLAIMIMVGVGIGYKANNSLTDTTQQVTEEDFNWALFGTVVLEIILGTIVVASVCQKVDYFKDCKKLEKDVILKLEQKIEQIKENLEKYCSSDRELVYNMRIILEFLNSKLDVNSLTEEESELLRQLEENNGNSLSLTK